jgi:nitroreductase
MDVKESMRNRHSVRNFSDIIPPEKLIDEIIMYANLAPSAGNLQARDFIIVDDEAIKKQLSNAAFNQTFLIEAPINIVVCVNLDRISPYGKRGRELYCIQDASAAVEHIQLLAVDSGLDTCWVGAFDERKVSSILRLPSHIRPVAILPLGYSSEQKAATSRMNPRLLTHRNQW